VRGSLEWQVPQAGVAGLPPANNWRWKVSPRAAAVAVAVVAAGAGRIAKASGETF
jgi:hypothetical protein